MGESEKSENNNTGEDQICTAKPCERARASEAPVVFGQVIVHVGEVIKRDLGKCSVGNLQSLTFFCRITRFIAALLADL